jgi:amino acid transporter
VFFSLAQDGLLPESLFVGPKKESGEKDITMKGLWLSSLAIAIPAGCLNVDVLLDMVTFGTLMNFSVVSATTCVSRLRESGRTKWTTQSRQTLASFCILTYLAFAILSTNAAAAYVLFSLSCELSVHLLFILRNSTSKEKRNAGALKV